MNDVSKPRGSRWRRPHWRKMTWVLIVWTLLFAIWIIAGVGTANNAEHCARESHLYLSQSACENARDAGTGIGAAVVLFLWFIGFVVLSLVWLMTRPKGRICPVCGEQVKKGLTRCPSCGHDFAAAVAGGMTAPEQA